MQNRIPDNHEVCLKYYELILVRREVKDIPVVPLPEGYRFVYYRPGDEKDWIAIETSAREFVLEKEGEAAWENYYRGKEEELTDRMFFIENAAGEKVATATAFYEPRDTSGAGWLHWVAIKSTEQGKGLARPLISKALHRLTELGYTDIKIPTQTNTWVAAKLYMDFGFIAEEKNAVHSRDGYRIMKTLTNHPSLEEIAPLLFEEIWDEEMVLIKEKLKSEYPDLLYFTVKEWKGGRKILYRTKEDTGILEINKFLMLEHEKLEEFICQYPVYQYAFFKPEEIEFSFRVRWICEQECGRFNSTWACPPAVGSVEECRHRCLQYKECFLFSTIAEVSDVINFDEMLSTRDGHEKITSDIETFIQSQGCECMALSTESCDICEKCTYPDGPCRFPDRMHPCVESHGIIVSELAEKYQMDFTLSPTQILWFGIIFIK